MCNDSLGRISFARCLIEVNSEADLVHAVTIGIPSLTEDDFTKETIRVEYEWRPPMCDLCKIFDHVHDHCPKKVASPLIVTTPNVVTPIIEKTNDNFQTKEDVVKQVKECRFDVEDFPRVYLTKAVEEDYNACDKINGSVFCCSVCEDNIDGRHFMRVIGHRRNVGGNGWWWVGYGGGGGDVGQWEEMGGGAILYF
ncbi:hypothetical protein Tco_0251625 [Tanacetum coccineum]